jgi:hypothetical protein
MALDVDDGDVSSDPDHGYSSERLRRTTFTDKNHSLASVVSAPYGIHTGCEIFDLELVLCSLR